MTRENEVVQTSRSLTPGQRHLLETVDIMCNETGEASVWTTQTAIARRCGMTPPVARQRICALADRGLITFEPADGRRRRYRVTAAGGRIVDARSIAGAVRELTSGMSDAEKVAMLERAFGGSHADQAA